MFDFSDAEEQREFGSNGPVPSGSIVMVEMEVLRPGENRQASDNPFISESYNGLRQIYCQFTVVHGTYNGVSFRQNITLPLGAQQVSMSKGQEKACQIGAAQLKAICLAARKPTRVNDIRSLTGLRFPVRVKINQRPNNTKDGRTFWNNEIAIVITPDKEAYSTVCNGGEIITDGPTTGNDSSPQQTQQEQKQGFNYSAFDVPEATGVDDVPF